jgi:hypothetical protein
VKNKERSKAYYRGFDDGINGLSDFVETDTAYGKLYWDGFSDGMVKRTDADRPNSDNKNR